MLEFENILRILAAASLVIGAVECFAGFKIRKVLIVLCGFFIGTVMGIVIGALSHSTVLGFICVFVFAFSLAFLSYAFYLAGIFLLTAFLTGVAVYIIFENIIITIPAAIAAGLISICFIKPVVIYTTALSGSGIMISSAYLMMNLRLDENPVLTAVMWVPIAIVGIVVQYITSRPYNKKKKLPRKKEDLSYSEIKFPGMQRAYRNFCIRCGCELSGAQKKCPCCGFEIKY